MPDDPLFPLSLYLYNADGYHDGPVPIDSEEALYGPISIIIRGHIASGLEATLTDPSDRCVFHAKDGKVLFPPQSEAA